MKDFSISMLQKILNKILHLDPESKNRIKQLNNQIVTLELLGLNLKFQLIFKDETIKLRTENFLPPHTTITGTPLTLLHLALTKDRKAFFAEDVQIEGNLDLGQDIIDLFDQLDLDFEEYLSRIVGDIPAHQIGRFISNVKKVNTRIRKSIGQNLNEYLHEEIALTPPPLALQDFFHDVDELRLDIDRMELRIQQLISKVQ